MVDWLTKEKKQHKERDKKTYRLNGWDEYTTKNIREIVEEDEIPFFNLIYLKMIK